MIKTRQQLQGELVQKKGVKDLQLKRDIRKHPYKNIYQAFRSIIQAEGVKGLQKGLSSALAFQFFMNSVRLGTYQTIDNLGWNRRKNGEIDPALAIMWGEREREIVENLIDIFSVIRISLNHMNFLSAGGMSGIFGSTVGCPLYMIKTQIQAQSYGTFAVGFQHGHKGTFDALRRILNESGIKGLWRGWTGILVRTAVGSSAQLV